MVSKIPRVSVFGYFPLGYLYYNTGCPYSVMGTEYGRVHWMPPLSI